MSRGIPPEKTFIVASLDIGEKPPTTALDALLRISDICKPNGFNGLSGRPTWDSGAGGNKERIWRIAEEAIAIVASANIGEKPHFPEEGTDEHGPARAIDRAVSLIEQHTPDLTDEDEYVITERAWSALNDVDGPDVADLAIRTCPCGEKIDGFYAYATHLKEVLSKEINT